MASSNRVQLATGRLDLTASRWQTAFLVSADGLVLTAGHGFSELASPLGDVFSIEFLDGINCSAELLDFEPDYLNGCDWGLLRIQGDTPPRIEPVELATPKPEQLLGKRYSALGYQVADRSLQVAVRGDIVNNAARLGSQRHWLLQLRTPPEDASGMSGAAICLADGRDVAVGIQSSQTRGRYNLFATPLVRLLNKRDDLDRVFAWRRGQGLAIVHSQLKKIDAKKPVAKPQERHAIFVLPPSLGGLGNDANGSLAENWQHFRGRLLRNLGLLGFGVPPSSLNLRRRETAPKNLATGPKGRMQLMPLDMAGSTLYRVVVDLRMAENHLGIQHTRLARPSHILEVEVTPGGLPDWEDSGGSGFDGIISVPASNVPELVSALQNIIEDVITDIYCFHSIAGLSQLFKGPEDRRRFSQVKLDFASRLGLKAWGLDLPPAGSLEYLPLASCARASVQQSFNAAAVRGLWNRFIHQYLLPGAEPSPNSPIPSLSLDEVISRVEDLPRIGPQINCRRLRRKLRERNLPAGGLAAVAIATQRPSKRSTRRSLAARFGYSRWTNNMASPFRSDEFVHLARYRDSLTMMVFRFDGVDARETAG